MKCAHCTASTRVLETRERAEFEVVRRHLCTNGHRFTTVQVLHTVAHTQRQWLRSAMARAMRGVMQRRARYAMRSAVSALLRRGEKHEVIVLELGCSERFVRTVAKELRES